MPEKNPSDRPVQLSSVRQLELVNLSGRLGYRFKDAALLDQALRHSSFAHENPEAGPSNEQMEFLGDAVLALTVSSLLLQHFPESSEGELSRGRAALVNARRLAVLARKLDLGSYLLLGRGEEAQAGREKPSLLADALEAVMAAVFLDGGLEAAEALTRSWFTPLLADMSESPWQDFKTRLQELTQARRQGSPTYNLLSESGPSHARIFEVEVCLGERPLARGQGRTKKQAEQLAAREALETLAEERRKGEGSRF
ncbi:MAG: ribonuclease III [Deltaproteobacteria bacterium]|nr:ribonuclease III [Deltaproteobacteria bacterium]